MRQINLIPQRLIMKNEIVIPLPTDFKVSINYEFLERTISEKTKIHIEEIWKEEIVRTQGKLFNGKLLSADDFDGSHLKGHFVEYKSYLAQVRDPSLADELAIQPICVCGYTTSNHEILVGKRSDHVTDYQNYYELVPAGGVDPSAIIEEQIDIIKQIKLELSEEAGIASSLIRQIKPSFLIIDSKTHNFEICAKIELDPITKKSLVERDDEYTELLWIPENKMHEFVERHRKKIIPLSLQILDLYSS